MVSPRHVGGLLAGCAAAWLLVSSAAAAPSVLRDGARAPGTSWRAQTADRDYSLTVDGDVYRFQIKAGDRRLRDGPSSTRRRSELTGVSAASSGYVELTWELRVEPAAFSSPTKYVLLQLQKGVEDPGDVSGEHPIVEFRLLPGGRPSLSVSGSDQKPLTDLPKSVSVWTGKPGDLPQGAWHQMRLILLQGGAAPSAELWIDGVRKTQFKGKVGYPNRAPAFFRFGVSEPSGDAQDTVVLVRHLRVSTPRPDDPTLR